MYGRFLGGIQVGRYPASTVELLLKPRSPLQSRLFKQTVYPEDAKISSKWRLHLLPPWLTCLAPMSWYDHSSSGLPSRTSNNPPQSKTLSDPTDAVLTLQGIGWLKRKAIGLATVTLSIKQYKDESGVDHIDIDQTATGGIKGTSEVRTLDWTDRSHDDHIFGSLVAKSRWLPNSGAEWDALDDFLKQDWLEEKVGPNGECFVQNSAVNESVGWFATQIWGFALINGVRYYTRRVVISKKDLSETLKVRLVYEKQD